MRKDSIALPGKPLVGISQFQNPPFPFPSYRGKRERRFA
jgi:hypothetical protein